MWGRIEVWRGTTLVLTHKIALGTTPQGFIANLRDVRDLVRDHVDVGGWLLNRGDMAEFPAGNYTVILFDENGVEVARRSVRLN